MGSESHHQKLLVETSGGSFRRKHPAEASGGSIWWKLPAEASGGSIWYRNEDKGIFPNFSPRISALTHICTRACVKFRLVVREKFGIGASLVPR